MTVKQRLMLRGVLHEVHVVTEWRNGCVYRTERVPGWIAARTSEVPLLKGGILVSQSTKDMKEEMEKMHPWSTI